MKKYIYFVVLLVSVSFLIVSNAYSQHTIDKVDKKFSNVTSVEVEGSFCDVKITGEKRIDVALTGEITSNKNYDIKIRYEQEGGNLKVWLDRPRSLRGNIKGTLNFAVPLNTNIDVTNSSGNVVVENSGQCVINLIAASGNISVRNIDSGISLTTSSGNLNIEDITGNVHATSASGTIYASGVKGNLYSVSSSGSQKIEGIKGNLKLTSSSGSIILNMISGNVNVRTSSGSIKADHVTGELIASSSSGSIRLDNVAGQLNLTSTSGSQKGTNVKLTDDSSFKSSSGSVSMQLINGADELSFELYASSGSLFAKGNSGDNKLIITREPIKIYGKTSSGSQSYR